jgi:hypothetical protein
LLLFYPMGLKLTSSYMPDWNLLRQTIPVLLSVAVSGLG